MPLTVVTGPMFAGKTEELQRVARRVVIAGHAVHYIRPLVDRPQGDESHGGRVLSGVRVHRVAVDARARPHVPQGAALVVLDEVQFYDPDRVVAWVRHWLARGHRIVAAGLDLDWQEVPFQATAGLLALADEVTKLTAVCARCGKDARRSFRLTDDTERVVVGNEYEPRCSVCFHGER